VKGGGFDGRDGFAVRANNVEAKQGVAAVVFNRDFLCILLILANITSNSEMRAVTVEMEALTVIHLRTSLVNKEVMCVVD